MRRIAVGFIACFCLRGFAYTDIEEASKSVLLQQEAISQAKDLHTAQYAGEDLRRIWPSTHPSDAEHETLTIFRSSFDFYIWRESTRLWMEVVPGGGDIPFICSSSFSVVQNGRLFDDPVLEKFSGGSQCGDVPVSSVFLLSYYSFAAAKPDYSQGFALHFDGDRERQISIPASTGIVPTSPNAPDCPVPEALPAFSAGILTIPRVRLPDGSYQATLQLVPGSSPYQFRVIGIKRN